jgi:hypothetical protein
MDAALEQPLVATISVDDCALRVFNYASHHCQVAKVFVNDADDKGDTLSPPMRLRAVAMAPSGLSVALAAASHVRVYSLLIDDVRLRGEVSLPHASLLRYSHGGQLLAAVAGKEVRVFAANTLKLVARLAGHQVGSITLASVNHARFGQSLLAFASKHSLSFLFFLPLLPNTHSRFFSSFLCFLPG